MRTEQEELGEFTRSKTVLKVLPMVDNFDRALEHLPEDIADHQWVEGILSLGKTLEKILREFEV